jgi:hypothetical protein
MNQPDKNKQKEGGGKDAFHAMRSLENMDLLIKAKSR